MKSLVIIFVAFALPALASQNRSELKVAHELQVGAKSTGVMKVKVVEVGEPIYQPYRMNITVKCDEKKGWEKLVTDKAVCDFAKHEFDQKKNILKIWYSTSEPKTGEAKCDSHWAQDFELDEICADD